MKSKSKIVLAYSGGLDTSIILKWLQENYDADVICYTADVGQEIDRKKIINNAKKFGVKNIIIQDLKDTFVKDYVYPMIRGHAIYEGVYLLGTSIARPLIAKRQIAVAKKFGAYAVSHGSVGEYPVYEGIRHWFLVRQHAAAPISVRDVALRQLVREIVQLLSRWTWWTACERPIRLDCAVVHG